MFASNFETLEISTTSAVTVAGSIIKAQGAENVQKYKRKDCPVCKGKGWYMSGDGIKKIECSYCEEEKSSAPIVKPKVVVHPPVTLKPNCSNGSCNIPQTIIVR